MPKRVVGDVAQHSIRQRRRPQRRKPMLHEMVTDTLRERLKRRSSKRLRVLSLRRRHVGKRLFERNKRGVA